MENFNNKWLPILSFGIGFIALIYALISINITKKVKRSNVILDLYSEYGSDIMLKRLRAIRRWEQKFVKFGDEFGKLRKDKYEEIEEIDKARRNIAHFFQKIYLLGINKVITKNEIMNLITIEQIDFYLDLIEPLERAINQDYNRDSFKYFHELKNIMLERKRKPNSYK